MASAEWALQQAMHTHLSAASNVQAQLGDPVRLYDQTPQERIYPFAIFGRSESRPVDADPGDTLEHIGHIHIWSRYGGRGEAKQAAGAVREALHHADLDVGDWSLVSLRVTYVDVLRGPDGFSYQAIVRFRAVVEGG